MARSINNLNVLNALIKDEMRASYDYAVLSSGKEVPPTMKRILQEMANDEKKHHDNLVAYKKSLNKK